MDILNIDNMPNALTDKSPWWSALRDWTDEAHEWMTTIDRFSADSTRKEAYVGKMVALLTSSSLNDSADGAADLCKALRIHARDRRGTAPLYTEAFVEWLIRACGLGREQENVPLRLDERDFQARALLVNVNVGLDGPAVVAQVMLAHESHLKVLSKLCAQRDARLFPLYRVLLQLASREERVRDDLLREGALPLLAERARETVCGYFDCPAPEEVDEASPAEIAFVQGDATELDACLRELGRDELALIEDLFRMAFVLTVPWGPASRAKAHSSDPDDDENLVIHPADSGAFFEIVAMARLILRNKPISAAEREANPVLVRLQGLRAGAIGCLLNTPRGQESVEMLERGRTAPEGSDASFLLAHMHNLAGETPLVRDQVATLLMLLHRMARASHEVREDMRAMIFPEDKYGRDVVKPGVVLPHASDDSTTNRIVKLMSQANAAISHYAQEFLFTLCEEDAEEFTRVVGFGSAAGLLAMRGLVNMPPDPLDKKEDKRVADPDKAAALMRQFTAAPENESEDARIIRQGRAMHDLEQMGVLNVVRKTDDATPKRAPGPSCAQCTRSNATQRCSRCKKVYYCDSDCQKRGWRTHKAGCEP